MKPPKDKKIVPPQEIVWEKFLDDTDDTDEPPAWHALVLEERAEEWKNPEKYARPFDEVIKELREEFRKNSKRGEN